ncbi:hypothetical protein [Absidia glauca]|uniref:Uncharacterized protein n=1 Tax=Absidia glauca TaxID=4829 RepID=A0A163J082_ABSGL|nr:hypothetical protein [Absidia glauca]
MIAVAKNNGNQETNLTSFYTASQSKREGNTLYYSRTGRLQVAVCAVITMYLYASQTENPFPWLVDDVYINPMNALWNTHHILNGETVSNACSGPQVDNRPYCGIPKGGNEGTTSLAQQQKQQPQQHHQQHQHQQMGETDGAS